MLEQINELRRIAADDAEDPYVRQEAAEALIELNTDGKVNGRYLAVKTTQNLAGIRRAADDPDAPDTVRTSARQELQTLAKLERPAEVAKESGLALARLTQLRESDARVERVGWKDADPLLREKHQVRKLVDLLRREHPQIVAVILVHLEPDQVSEVLRRFPEGHRNEVIIRLATLDGVQPAALKELSDVLSKVLAGGDRMRKANMGGVKSAAEVLNLLTLSFGPAEAQRRLQPLQ